MCGQSCLILNVCSYYISGYISTTARESHLFSRIYSSRSIPCNIIASLANISVPFTDRYQWNRQWQNNWWSGVRGCSIGQSGVLKQSKTSREKQKRKVSLNLAPNSRQLYLARGQKNHFAASAGQLPSSV